MRSLHLPLLAWPWLLPQGLRTTRSRPSRAAFCRTCQPSPPVSAVFPELRLTAGNVLIALSDYNIVVRLDQASGSLTRVAGNGVKGFNGDNGPATQAELSGPTGIAVDAAGNLYIADFNNNRVRAVSNGVIRTVAERGSRDTRRPGPRSCRAVERPDGCRGRCGRQFIYRRFLQSGDPAGGKRLHQHLRGQRQLRLRGRRRPADQAQLGGPFGIAVDAGAICISPESITVRYAVLPRV